MMNEFDDAAHYTTRQDNNYFGWEDAQKDTVRQLASSSSTASPPSPGWAKVRTYRI
jgi:hypothetical protein